MDKKYGKSPQQRLEDALNQVPSRHKSIVGESGNAKQIDAEDLNKACDKILLDLAMNRIIAELEKDRGDDSYYTAWQKAIAQCIKARLRREMETNRSFYICGWMLEDVANQSAKMFLNSLCSQPKILELKKPNE